MCSWVRIPEIWLFLCSKLRYIGLHNQFIHNSPPSSAPPKPQYAITRTQSITSAFEAEGSGHSYYAPYWEEKNNVTPSLTLFLMLMNQQNIIWCSTIQWVKTAAKIMKQDAVGCYLLHCRSSIRHRIEIWSSHPHPWACLIVSYLPKSQKNGNSIECIHEAHEFYPFLDMTDAPIHIGTAV